MTRNSLGTLALLLAAACCAIATCWTDTRLAQQRWHSAAQHEFIYVAPARFLKLIALKYEHTLADVLWFRTTSYFANHYRSDRVYPWLAYMCDVVTDLDPRADYVYRFGGVILPWEADRVDDGIALLKKGTHNMPDSWRLWYMLGFNYYFFKNDLGAASRALEYATRLPHAPEFVSRVAATILAAHHGTDRAVAFLTELQREKLDPEMQTAIRQRIRELTLAANIDALEAAIKTYEARFLHTPFDVDVLVSSGILDTIPPDPFDGHYLIDIVTGAVRSSAGGKGRRLGSSRLREEFLKRQDTGS